LGIGLVGLTWTQPIKTTENYVELLHNVTVHVLNAQASSQNTNIKNVPLNQKLTTRKKR